MGQAPIKLSLCSLHKANTLRLQIQPETISAIILTGAMDRFALLSQAPDIPLQGHNIAVLSYQDYARHSGPVTPLDVVAYINIERIDAQSSTKIISNDWQFFRMNTGKLVSGNASGCDWSD
jgi:hypothetical protein